MTVTFAGSPTAATRPPADAGMSLVNLAARQRMLSQRMILQCVLAARGDAAQLTAARRSLALFSDSQARLVATPRELDAAGAALVRETYTGPKGVGPTLERFLVLMRNALDHVEQRDERLHASLDALVACTDAVLDALNTATTAFDRVQAAKSESVLRELSEIVASIQTVSREAKVVSFNAQVMAARAGQQGREFSVVADRLSGVTSEIDQLSHKALALARLARPQG